MSSPKNIGLIAGEGELPLAFAYQAKTLGFSLRAVAIEGAASKRLKSHCDEIEWISIGQLGRLISFFKKNRVNRVVMHGKIQHADLLRNPRLDFTALSLLVRTKDWSGESLLRAFSDELSRHQIQVSDSRFLMKSFLASADSVTSLKPNREAQKTIRFALEKARVLARVAIGQVLVVKKRAVVAVEGVEGTNDTIRRAGKWAGPGIIVVKVASPRQDWRFDVPTIGLKTLQTMAQVRAAGIAVEARRIFILNKEKTLTFAQKHGVFVSVVS